MAWIIHYPRIVSGTLNGSITGFIASPLPYKSFFKNFYSNVHVYKRKRIILPKSSRHCMYMCVCVHDKESAHDKKKKNVCGRKKEVGCYGYIGVDVESDLSWMTRVGHHWKLFVRLFLASSMRFKRDWMDLFGISLELGWDHPHPHPHSSSFCSNSYPFKKSPDPSILDHLPKKKEKKKSSIWCRKLEESSDFW